MFLFHWCMNAVRCRRDMTLETMPLSPTKYNGLPPALDCGLQGHLVDDIPSFSYEVTGISRSLMDEEEPLDHSSFFHDRLNTICPRDVDDGQDSTTPLSSCHSESHEWVHAMTGSHLHPRDLDKPTTSRLSSTLNTHDVSDNGISEHCGYECETAAAVNENTERVDVSSKSVPSCTDFCASSTQFPRPQLYPEMQRGVHSSDKEISLVIDNDLPRNTQDDNIADVHVLDMPQQNSATSFPGDTFQDPLVTVAMLLVNSAVNSAVKILNEDLTFTLEKNPIDEIDLLPISNTSNSIQQLPFSDESSKASEDPIQATASRLVNQVLSEIVRKNSGSVLACAETLPGETSITTAACAARSDYSSSPCSGCESDSKLSADSDVKSCATAKANGVLMPAAVVEDYLSESSTTGCSSVDTPELLETQVPVCVPNCDYNSVYALYDDFQYMTSLSGGQLTFVSEGWRPVSPPFTDAYSPNDVSEVLNNNTVVVRLFDDVDGHQCASDNPNLYDYLRYTDDDAQARMMCSEIPAGRDVDVLCNRGIDNATKSPVDHNVSDDDNYPDIHPSMKQYVSESEVAETWNSRESSYRPEDYFFHRYVIPVEQLDADEAISTTSSDLSSDTMTVQSDRDEQRIKMQLDLKADEQNNGTGIDAEIEAVAAFCRAMFTSVETDNDETLMPFDMVSSPETPDTEERYTRGGRPTGVRRCISLRTSPGTPHKKKSVRFADALGLDLECVRQIQTVEEQLPTLSGYDDGGWRRRPLLAEASAAWHRSRPPVRRYLCACFQAPGSLPDFVERVRRWRVLLESCKADDRSLTITGVVRVANVAYHKTVAARVTTDGWATQTDVTADYVPRSNDGTTDRFSFQIVLPHGATDLGRRVEFAVCFIAFFDFDNRSETYWDNNFGANYCFECYAHDDDETVASEMDKDDGQFSPWLRFV